MLGTLLTCTLALAPQDRGPRALAANVAAVAVRGEAELSVAEAFRSARRKAEDHVRSRWQDRASRVIAAQRPFWVPAPLAEHATSRWLAEQPVDELARLVDREDRQRAHEFGDSWQTTLWVAEDPRALEQAERRLRRELRRLERTTAVKYGGIVGGWVVLAILVGWLDRLSRGYMTGRLRLVGLLGGLAVPAIAFLV